MLADGVSEGEELISGISISAQFEVNGNRCRELSLAYLPG